MEAAIAEVLAVGATGVSMREVARRAGVSHAALAYQFGDKAGLFTEIATIGFQLATQVIGAAATGANAFLDGGVAYIIFALTYPAHFDVMFRPDLYNADDAALREARDKAFDVLYGSARASLEAGPDDDVTDVAVAGWSFSHGFATLWLNANLQDRIGAQDQQELTMRLTRGIAALGELARRRLDQS